MNDFPAFAAIIGLLGLIRSLSLLGKESFWDLQAVIVGDVSYFLGAGLGGLCAFFSYRLFTCNTYGFSKGELFATLLLFLGNVFWVAVFLVPPKDSKITSKIKTLCNKVFSKPTARSRETTQKTAAKLYSNSYDLYVLAKTIVSDDTSFETYFLLKLESLPSVESYRDLCRRSREIYAIYWEAFEVYSKSVCNNFASLFTKDLSADEIQEFQKNIETNLKQFPESTDSLFLVGDIYKCASSLCKFDSYEETFIKDHARNLNYQQVSKPLKIALDKFNETFEVSEEELKNILMPD